MSRSQEGVSVTWLAAGPVAVVTAVGTDLFFRNMQGGALQTNASMAASALGLASGLVVGGIVEALILFLSRLTEPLVEGTSRTRGLLWWQLLSVPWLPLSWVLSAGALSGHRVQRFADPAWSVPLAALALSLFMGAVSLVALWMFLRQRSGRMTKRWRFTGIAGLFGAAVSLSGLNARLYVRLYPEIHGAMTLVSTLVLLFAAGLVFSNWKTKYSRALVLSLLFLVAGAAMGRPAVGPLRRSQRVRRLVFSLPTTSLILSLVARRAAGRSDVAGAQGGPRDGESLAGLERGPIELDGASVLLVTVDALRADRVGCLGLRPGGSLTPNIDELCRKSVRFERAYCHAPHSSYSLSSIQTGMPIRSLVSLGEPLPRTLADILSNRGYRTEAFCTNGIFFTEGERLAKYRRNGFGFAHLDPNGYDGKVLTEKAIDALDRLASDSRPFYLWVHYFDVHEPYRVHPGITEGKRPRDRYDGEVRYVDPLVAKLIRHALNLGRPLVVVLTADHGEEFGEHGGSYHGSSVYEEQVRVPLLWWLSGVSPRRVGEPVSLIDVMPTILDVVGVPYQGAVEGRSLAALALGGEGGHGPVYAEVATKKMVVDGVSKLIYDSWRSIVELYDLGSDPREKRNLADSRPTLVTRLRRLLASHAAHLSRRLAGLPRALALARLGDAGAKDGLCRLLLDGGSELCYRIEAARRLAKMPGGCSEKALCDALLLPGGRLRQEAAVALGELESPCGRTELRMLLSEAQPARLRHRAAVAAGRLGLKEAQPYLVEALADPDETIRYRAGHYLGRIGDGRAVGALIAASADRRAAHLVAFALGRVGARSGGQVKARVSRFLRDWLPRAHSLLVKRYILKAMGLLGNPDLAAAAVPFLGRASVREAEETLVRCHGIGRLAFGLDFSPLLASSSGLPARPSNGLPADTPLPRAVGLTHCRSRDPLDFEYLHDTVCRARGPMQLVFVGPEVLRGSWVASLRARGLGNPAGEVRIHLWLEGRDLGIRKLKAGWQDVTWRFNVSEKALGEQRHSRGAAAPRRRSEGPLVAAGQGTEGRVVRASIQVEPAGIELELDHFLMRPARQGGQKGAGRRPPLPRTVTGVESGRAE